MKMIKINGIEFAADEIRNAKWTTESSDLSVYIDVNHERGEDDLEQEIERINEDEGRVKWTATLIRSRVEDEEPWEVAYAHATAIDGRKFTLFVEDSGDSKKLIQEGWVDYYNIDADRIETIEDEAGYDPSDLASVCDTLPDVDMSNGIPDYAAYKSSAEDYVSELPPCARVWIDRARGFANEWTLFIDRTGAADARDEWEAVDESYFVSYLADAICPSDVYHNEHLSVKCVAAYEIA